MPIAGLDLNVYGAGLAATLSTWVSCITLIGLMLRRKVLNPADLASPPTQAEVVPYLWKGAVLAFRMIVTFGEQTRPPFSRPCRLQQTLLAWGWGAKTV